MNTTFHVFDISSQYTTKRVNSFNHSARYAKFAGTFVSCRSVIDIPSGEHNHSYGAICLVDDKDKQLDVGVCNDEMVGHFRVERLNHEQWNKEQLIRFVMKHCVGG
jgi:hypothetical protein